MTNIEQSPHQAEYQSPSSWTALREQRQTQRELAQLDGQTTRELNRIDAVVEQDKARIAALNHVGTSAMVQIAQLSQTETTLAQMVPHASGRLAAVADLTAIQSAEVLIDSARRIRGRSR